MVRIILIVLALTLTACKSTKNVKCDSYAQSTK